MNKRLHVEGVSHLLPGHEHRVEEKDVIMAPLLINKSISQHFLAIAIIFLDKRRSFSLNSSFFFLAREWA